MKDLRKKAQARVMAAGARLEDLIKAQPHLQQVLGMGMFGVGGGLALGTGMGITARPIQMSIDGMQGDDVFGNAGRDIEQSAYVTSAGATLGAALGAISRARKDGRRFTNLDDMMVGGMGGAAIAGTGINAAQIVNALNSRDEIDPEVGYL